MLRQLIKLTNRRVVVFDLDKTLWDFTVECEHAGKLYVNTKPLLTTLRNDGYILAISSRGHLPDLSVHYMKHFGIWNFFDADNIQIFPSGLDKDPPFNKYICKEGHFANIMRNTNTTESDLLFIDDDEHICKSMSRLTPNVKIIHTPFGV